MHSKWHNLLIPEVFSHPIWANYCGSGKPISPDLVLSLNNVFNKFYSEGKINEACEVLFLCTALEKKFKSPQKSLEYILNAWQIATRHQQPTLQKWAAWGVISISYWAGDLKTARTYSDLLVQLLLKEDEWLLANLITVLKSTLQDPPNIYVDDNDTLAWLNEWGKPFSEFRINNILALVSERRPNYVWVLKSPLLFVKRLFRGELRSTWLNTSNRDTPLGEVEATINQVEGSLGARSTELLDELKSSAVRNPPGVRPTSSPPMKILEYPKNDITLITQHEYLASNTSLVVYCLGPFRVFLNDKMVENWFSGKGKTIFKYLISHRNSPVSKDFLMDIFWREAVPESARNNLNVAIYGLRQALRVVQPAFSYILYRDERYSFNPAMEVWVDVEEFTQHYQAGQGLQKSVRLAEAVSEYEQAESLYQGDFLEEDLYEDWAISIRESLKASYLTVLDRLSRYYFEEKRFATCILLCQKILGEDDCREDAHRRLMHCYFYQGQPHLAVRQYQLCLETLKNVLDMPPTKDTKELLEMIRLHNRV